uniref:ABC transmembrane type-2 domain-containing protein n=1 Tax=Compsothamnion thuioides TaxID=3097386 RepID=A0A4D6WQ97_9FLOR|nr:hypothetical protein [Compsothamnion thuyoides]
MFISKNAKKYLISFKDYNIKPKKYINQKLKKQNLLQEIKALTKRLYIQVYRKPAILIVGIIQPLLWLILFSALFQNAPINLITNNIKYGEFVSPGIIIFTAFTGSMNAGLPIIFDREFGFLNRLLISPLKNRNSLLFSSLISVWTITIFQIIIIIICNIFLLKNLSILLNIYSTISLTTLIIINIASISLCLSFILPGHIEFLGFILITNLPILFSSTALAPLSFMPYWLQILTCFNPLTYAIEILRFLYTHTYINYNNKIIETIWITMNLSESILVLLIINIINLTLVKHILTYKYE